MGSNSSSQTSEIIEEYPPHSFGETRDSSSTVDEPNRGDVLIAYSEKNSGVKVKGVDQFVRLGIYVGNRNAISCVKVSNPTDARGELSSIKISGFRVVLEDIRSEQWKGWVIDEKAREKGANNSCADKAMMEYQAYQQGVPDNYHLKGDNCQNFTEYCLHAGIGSTVKK